MIAPALLALALSADPAVVRLGSDARAVLRVEAESEPAISASAGKVGPVRRGEAGGWEADYVPPDDALPQVALVIAVSGGQATWAAVPLWGQGDAVVKTRPRGRITVEIGNQIFGPAVADQDGQAVVPVVVPPGVGEARHGKRIIPLHVPASRTVHVALGEAATAADRAQTVAVYVAAATPAGQPRTGAAIHLRATRGELSGLQEVAPGLYQASLALSAGRPGEVRVTAALAVAPQFVAATSLTLGGGLAKQIRITADRQRIAADEPRARLHVSAQDSAGNAAGETLRFESTAGQVSAAATAAGEWDLTLTLQPSFAGRNSVEVRALGTSASEVRQLALVPGAPETAAFERPSAAVVADGKSRLSLRIQLRDRYGNPVQGVRPEVSAEQGSAEIEERDGALYASYVPPLLEGRGDTTLSLRAGRLEGRAQVALLPNVKAAAVGAKAGLLTNFSGFSVPLIGIEAALRSALLGPELALSLSADYGHRTQSELVPAGAGDVTADSRIDLLLVNLSASWRRPFGAGNAFWIGAGPCAAAYWTRVGGVDMPARRGFAIAPGLQGTFGAERRLRWGVPFIEGRAAWVTSPGLPILTGPLRTLTLMAGVRLEAL